MLSLMFVEELGTCSAGLNSVVVLKEISALLLILLFLRGGGFPALPEA